MIEHWQKIPSLNGYYEASNLGRIRRSKPGMNTKPGRVKKLAENPNGYVQVATSINGNARRHWVHRLVAEAFLQVDIAGLEVHHKDGNPTNNRLDNLQVVTTKQNRRLDLIRAISELERQVAKWRRDIEQ